MFVTVGVVFLWIMVYVVVLLSQVTVEMLSVHAFFLFIILMVNTIEGGSNPLSEITHTAQ